MPGGPLVVVRAHEGAKARGCRPVRRGTAHRGPEERPVRVRQEGPAGRDPRGRRRCHRPGLHDYRPRTRGWVHRHAEMAEAQWGGAPGAPGRGENRGPESALSPSWHRARNGVERAARRRAMPGRAPEAARFYSALRRVSVVLQSCRACARRRPRVLPRKECAAPRGRTPAIVAPGHGRVEDRTATAPNPLADNPSCGTYRHRPRW